MHSALVFGYAGLESESAPRAKDLVLLAWEGLCVLLAMLGRSDELHAASVHAMQITQRHMPGERTPVLDAAAQTLLPALRRLVGEQGWDDDAARHGLTVVLEKAARVGRPWCLFLRLLRGESLDVTPSASGGGAQQHTVGQRVCRYFKKTTSCKGGVYAGTVMQHCQHTRKYRIVYDDDDWEVVDEATPTTPILRMGVLPTVAMEAPGSAKVSHTAWLSEERRCYLEVVRENDKMVVKLENDGMGGMGLMVDYDATVNFFSSSALVTGDNALRGCLERGVVALRAVGNNRSAKMYCRCHAGGRMGTYHREGDCTKRVPKRKRV